MALTINDVDVNGRVSLARVQEEVTYLRAGLQEAMENLRAMEPPKERVQLMVYNKLGKALAQKQLDIMTYLDEGLYTTFHPK